MENNFDVESFLLSKFDNMVLMENDFFIIDRLCKKIDVVKKVYCFYSQDLAVKKSGQEIGVDAYIVLLELLQITELLDYKFLNSAFKLNDILLSKKYITEEIAKANSKQISVKIESLIIK